MAGGPRPDYEIKALNTETRDSVDVGAGWAKEEGRISVKLNYFVDLNQLRGPNVIITLFPVREKKK